MIKKRYKIPFAVFMLLIREDKILIIKRQYTGWMDGYYSIPAGGLEMNESLLNAAIREVFEETGITVKEENCTLFHLMHCKIDKEIWTGAFFASKKFIGEPIVKEPHKHSEVAWITFQKIPENIVPYVKQAIDAYQSMLLYSEFGWDKKIVLK